MLNSRRAHHHDAQAGGILAEGATHGARGELLEKLPRALLSAPSVSRPDFKKLREGIRDRLKAEDSTYLPRRRRSDSGD
jgi:hypothetical protein